MMPRAHARDLRKGRWSESGQVYLVTAVTRDRRPVFSGFQAARVLIQALRQEETRGRAKTLAFVVMPDHLHWLLQLGEGSDLSEVVRAVKAVSAKRLGGSLWQRGFHDHALRQEEDLAAAARYVIANPLRRGLVKCVADYPHWDAVWV
jgi:REP element-mobilizing transposase RayT